MAFTHTRFFSTSQEGVTAVAAARKAPLRAVKPGEKKAPTRRATKKAAPKPKTVSQAAVLDDPRELLVAMRDRLALAVENLNTPPRDLAALTRRLHEVVRDIAAIDAAKDEGDGIGAAAATPDEEFDEELEAEAL